MGRGVFHVPEGYSSVLWGVAVVLRDCLLAVAALQWCAGRLLAASLQTLHYMALQCSPWWA
jgi:hypothetical protein